MNCFEARSDFVAFWQKTLAYERRAQLLFHLNGCTRCDHSFRIFALSAPGIYSAIEPDWSSAADRRPSLNREALGPSRAWSSAERPSIVQMLTRVLPAFVMAAAAAFVLYFAAPAPMTFEDAIIAGNLNAEGATYPATDSVFGRELMAQDTTAPDVSDE